MDTHLDIVHVKIYAIHLPTPAAAWAGSVCRNYYTGTTKCICAYVHPLLLDTLSPQPGCSRRPLLQQLLSPAAIQGKWCWKGKRREIKGMWLVLCGPSAPLLCPEQGPALRIPCTRFIAHFASGLHFNPTFHSPGVLSLQQTEDTTPLCPSSPTPTSPSQEHKAQEGCWLERAARITHHRCSLRGQRGPDTGTEAMQRVGERELEEGKIKDEKGRTDLRRRKNTAWQVLKASCFLVLFL